MKKYLSFFWFLSVVFSSFGQGMSKDQLIEKTSNCTSNSTEIIESSEDEFVKFMMSGFEGSSFLSKYGLVVHECLHGYDNILDEGIDWDNSTYPIAYFVDKDIVIKFAGKRLFKTEELHDAFFSPDVKNLFRYETYIQDKNGPSQSSSNQWGIYGLIEEFNAYYHDLRAQIEYFTCSGDPSLKEEVFANNMHAYFEFNIFIADYLQFAKENHLQDYQYIMNNMPLRKAYSLMEYNWRNLITIIMNNEDMSRRTPSYDEELRLLNDQRRTVLNSFMLSAEELTEFSDFIQSRPSDLQIIKGHKDWAGQVNLSGFGSGMSPDELAENLEQGNGISLDIEMKESGKFYVVTLATKSEETLIEELMKCLSDNKQVGGVFMDDSLTFFVYLKKFNTEEKANKYAQDAKKDFPTVKVIK